jgi:circadian clock protein KaiC
MDPVTNLNAVGGEAEITAMLTRVIDYLKQAEITALFTSLTGGGAAVEQTDVGISSLMDTWLLLRQDSLAGDRRRLLYILKSRGMAHSSEVRPFALTAGGIRLEDAQ